ncbi:hypothetical protein A9Q99_17780 [Gammaproteobacteria bacterium 45_16_T64]|nr:hypothetical protein A9Q99_17780 [Gammaproteobacteria bacterium 45_16_T64]
MRNISASKIYISHVGLTERDITFIHNLFRLGAKQFRDYELVDYSASINSHVVIINGDDNHAHRIWRKIKDTVTTIFISQENLSPADQNHVVRPLVFRKLIDAFTQAEAEDKTLNEERTQVLVVDDSLPIRRFMELKLPSMTDIPIAIDYAEDGESAQEKTLGKIYDIIFLDVVLPGIDGYQVCKSIKEVSDTFVVMLTSNKSPFDRVRGGMSGCDAYLTKPPKDEQLRKVFQKMIDKSHKQHDSLIANSSQR